MDYVKPFTFLFKQRHAAATLAIGSLMILIPVVGQIALYGWVLLVYRALLEGREEVPPLELSDFSRLLQLGIGPWLVALVVGFAVSIVFVPVYMIFGFGSGIAMPLIAQSGSEEVAIIVMFVMMGLMFVAMLVLSYFSVAVMNVALIRAELGSDVGTAFAGLGPGSVWRFMRSIRKEIFWTTVAYSFGAGLIAFIGMILLYIGVFPAMVVAVAAGAHFRYQLYTAYLARGGTPLPVYPIAPGPGAGYPPASSGTALPYGGAPGQGQGQGWGPPPPT